MNFWSSFINWGNRLIDSARRLRSGRSEESCLRHSLVLPRSGLGLRDKVMFDEARRQRLKRECLRTMRDYVEFSTYPDLDLCGLLLLAMDDVKERAVQAKKDLSYGKRHLKVFPGGLSHEPETSPPKPSA